MRYVTLAILLSGAAAAQTPNWRQRDWQQYFKQFKFPEAKSVVVTPRKCAIPLLNVLKKDPTNDDKMVIHPPKSDQTNTFVIAPPMPACDEAR